MQKHKNDRTLSDMFSPPENVLYHGGFQDARQFAKSQNKWLLVNVQSDAEFACHALNRDVWKDSVVQSIIADSFVFWQCDESQGEGVTFKERYMVDRFPWIGIIDPRTAGIRWQKSGWTMERGFSSEDFVEVVLDFLSQNDLGAAVPPPVPLASAAKKVETSVKGGNGSDGGGSGFGNSNSNSNSNSHKRPADFLTEEEQMAAAMKASMEGDSCSNNDDNNNAMTGADDNDNENSYESPVTMAQQFGGPDPPEPTGAEPSVRVAFRLVNDQRVVR